MSRIVCITGATSGIGRACAERYAQAGDDLIITGRRAERLQQLKQQLQDQHGVRVHALHLDVRDRASVENAFQGLPVEWQAVDVLINNAGLALGLQPLHEGNPDDWDVMVDTNIKGLLYVTRALAPGMIGRRRGHVVNIGSTAAKDTYPNGNVYCATKRAVEALSEAMRIDFLPYGIKVTAVHPGAVKTEFSIVRFKGDTHRAAQVYQGFQPLTPADVAEVIFYCTSLPPHVCINDLVLTPTAQANAHFIHKQSG
ncbi:MAG: SDR family NAD(P)-dependent oxidoreductase [Thermoflavifilum aggregans]|nr:SDR family NAD(P)-dependent oxidoreductase [Thermoflavifilum aggregans]